MNLLDRFLNRTHFDDYDDFSRNIKVTVPDNFNFAYDVVDEYARLCPDKRALVWANDKGEEKILTFGELKTLSDKAVNILLKNKLKKGDFVMTMLNRRYEYWILAVACHKLGVVIVPATHLLTPKDIAYRCNQAKVKLLFITKETDVLEHVYYALPSCSTLQKVYCTEEAESGVINWRKRSFQERTLYAAGHSMVYLCRFTLRNSRTVVPVRHISCFSFHRLRRHCQNIFSSQLFLFKERVQNTYFYTTSIIYR